MKKKQLKKRVEKLEAQVLGLSCSVKQSRRNALACWGRMKVLEARIEDLTNRFEEQPEDEPFVPPVIEVKEADPDLERLLNEEVDSAREAARLGDSEDFRPHKFFGQPGPSFDFCDVCDMHRSHSLHV